MLFIDETEADADIDPHWKRILMSVEPDTIGKFLSEIRILDDV
jgi:hypothetical protein